MHPVLTIILTILATIAAIASAISAWKSQSTASELLNFQKKLSKHQDFLFLIRSTIELLWQFRRVIRSPIDASDEEFYRLENTHRQIKSNIESLVRSRTVERRESRFFDAKSRGEIFDLIPVADHEIELEINRLQSKMNQIFS